MREMGAWLVAGFGCGEVDGVGLAAAAHSDVGPLPVGVPVDEPMVLERFPKPRGLWRLSVALDLPTQGRLTELLTLLPSLRFIWGERVWALAPFHLRFF